MKNAFLSLFIIGTIAILNSQPPCRSVFDNSPLIDTTPGCLVCQDIYFNPNPQLVLTPDTVGVDFPCGEILGNQWMTILADTTGNISAMFLFGSCNDDKDRGVKMRLYDMNLNPVSDCVNSCDGADINNNFLDANDLVPRAPYLLMVDICEVDVVCDFFLFFNQYKPTISPDSPEITVEPNYNSYCVGNKVCYSSNRVDGSDGFEWQIDSTEVRIIEGGGIQDSFICVEFLRNSSGRIFLTPLVECWQGTPTNTPYDVNKIDLDVVETICPGETYFIGSDQYTIPGNYTAIFTNAPPLNCDSVVHLELLMPDTSAVTIGCFLDTFLNAVTIFWDSKPLADQYQIIVNDSVLQLQNYQGLIYQSDSIPEVLDIEVLPIGVHGCEYRTGYGTCKVSDLTPTRIPIKEGNVTVFPNPSLGVFDLLSDIKIKKIEVFDFTGKYKKEVFESKVDISEFESGVYFLKIHIENKVVLKKVVKI